MTATTVLPPLLKSLSLTGLAVAVATSAFMYVASGSDSSPRSTSAASAATPIATTSTAKLTAFAAPSTGPVEFEMDWPNHGAVYPSPSGDSFRGYTTEPGVPVVIQALNPTTGGWETLGNTSAAVVPSSLPSSPYVNRPAYAWSFPATVPAFWSTAQHDGGVLRLRALPQPTSGLAINTYDFDVDGQSCLNGKYAQALYSRNADWINAASVCRSPFPIALPSLGAGASGATVLSTDLVPTNLGRTFISMVSPLSGDGADPADVGNHYYTLSAPASLTAFKQRYGFSDTRPYTNGEVEATYYNKGDLGIGRNMHCRIFIDATGRGLACYVRNYANNKGLAGVDTVDFGADETAYLDAAIHADATKHFATVAMVQYDNSPRVDFMVYAFKLRTRTGQIVEFLSPTATLDNNASNIAVPTNCQSCHGGTYSGSTTQGGIATGARFLPFDSDPRMLTFATGALATANPGFTQSAQASNIRALNDMIFGFQQTPADEKKHIATMYGNETGTSLGTDYVQGYLPSAWNQSTASAKLYREVVKPYCLGCHVSWPNPTSYYATHNFFANYSGFVANKSSVRYAVCDPHNDRRMPAAEQTNSNFWKSPGRAYLLNHVDDSGTSPCNP